MELITDIESFYPGRFDADAIAKPWWKVLKHYDYNRADRELQEHVKTERFPPTISDLIEAQEQTKKSPSNVRLEEITGRSQRTFEQSIEQYDQEIKKSGYKIDRSEFDQFAKLMEDEKK